MAQNKLRLDLMIRIVGHDGYCSDAENEASVEFEIKKINIPKPLSGCLGTVLDPKEVQEYFGKKFKLM